MSSNRPFNLDKITVEDIMGNLDIGLWSYESGIAGAEHSEEFRKGIVYGIAEAMSTIRSLELLRLVRDKDFRATSDLYHRLDELIIDIRKTDGTIVRGVITDRGMNFETGVIDITVQDRSETNL